jgi:dihydrofolate reductase
MRKVILNLAVSLDGYIEGPDGAYDWCFTDQDYGMSTFFDDIDTVLMGRKSYELVTAAGDQDAFPGFAKYIFSDTLKETSLNNTEIVGSADFAEQVKALKDAEGQNIWLFGGANLMNSFIQNKLIDVFMLSVHPVLLGGGKPLFSHLRNRQELLHTQTTTYPSGLVQLAYVPKPEFDLNTFLG